MSLIHCTECKCSIHIQRVINTRYQLCDKCAEKHGIDLETAARKVRLMSDKIHDFKRALEDLAKEKGDEAEALAKKLKREYDNIEDELKENLDKLPWHNRWLWAILVIAFFAGLFVGVPL